jgi:hypothetical protein
MQYINIGKSNKEIGATNCLKPVGLNEAVIREYIHNQEDDDRRQDHLDLMAE